MNGTEGTTGPRHCQRPGCTGILRNEESIARGTSKACDKIIRQAGAAEAGAGGFTADQQAKALAAIRSGEVRAEAPGLYSVLSSKGDGTRYATDGNSCVCPAGARQHPRRCWHLLVARVMDALTRPARSRQRLAA